MAFFYPTQQQPVAEQPAAKRRAGQPPGERHTRAKLTERQVAEIKRRITSGETTAAIARRYGVTPAAIYMIRRGRSWGHVHVDGFHPEQPQGKAPGRQAVAHLSAKQVLQIKRSLAAGGRVSQLARDYGVQYQVIWNIRAGKTWSDIQPGDQP